MPKKQPNNTVHLDRRAFLQAIAAGGTGALLGGCRELADLLHPLPEIDTRPPISTALELESHLLNRLSYGPTPGAYRRVKTMGSAAFIDEQLHPENLDDSHCEWLVASIESLAESTAELYEYDPEELLVDLSRYKLLRAVYSRRQLYEVMVDFWSDHFNIVAHKGDCRWLKAEDDHRVIRQHALGRFRDLVRASATSPAMLIYLDGHANRVESPTDRPNENYARELLELHTLGVDSGYTQRDVSETARCLSGWTYSNEPFSWRALHVEFDPARHDNGEKQVLGHTIPADGGAGDLERVVDIACAHPATADHIATKLCRFFIDTVPPEASIKNVAHSFSLSGGDIRLTLETLFADEGFKRSRGTLLKRPLRFVVSALRASGAQSDCGPPILSYLERMGHAPFQYPTPDGYPIEPQPWMGGLLWRWNFAKHLAADLLEGTTPDAERLSDLPQDIAARLLGRSPTALEATCLNATIDPLALALASPAFQYH
jgi:uncharacterized protein (DUF1800 family)